MKKILLICPEYFEYHKIILNELLSRGFEAEWMDDRPDSNFITKCIIRLNKNILQFKINKYSEKIFNTIADKKIDICIIIIGQSFTAKDLEKWKKANPNCKFVFYARDSFANFKNMLGIAKQCDYAYSFNESDNQLYNQIKFLPLFYTKKLDAPKIIQYDFSFIATIKPGKYKRVKELIDLLSEKYEKSFIYMYIQSPLILLYYKIRYREFRKAKFSYFKFKKLTYNESIDVFRKSKMIVECPMNNQNGLSIKVIESLACRSKILTLNTEISKYDFYNKNNIFIFDNAIDFNDGFFKGEFLFDEKFLVKYSISNFISTLLNNLV